MQVISPYLGHGAGLDFPLDSLTCSLQFAVVVPDALDVGRSVVNSILLLHNHLPQAFSLRVEVLKLFLAICGQLMVVAQAGARAKCTVETFSPLQH